MVTVTFMAALFLPKPLVVSVSVAPLTYVITAGAVNILNLFEFITPV